MTTTNKMTKKQANAAIDRVIEEIERCETELQNLPKGKRYDARRRETQRRMYDLGDQVRELLGICIQ